MTKATVTLKVKIKCIAWKCKTVNCEKIDNGFVDLKCQMPWNNSRKTHIVYYKDFCFHFEKKKKNDFK